MSYIFEKCDFLFNFIVVGENKLFKDFAGLLLPLLPAYQTADSDPGIQHRFGLPAGAADHGSGNTAVRVFLEDGSCHKGTHGMPEKHIGKVWEFLAGILQQLTAVLHGSEPAAVEIALNAFAADGFAVTHMVFRYYQKSQPVQIPGKIVIALDILCNAVNDLKNRNRRLLRCPATAVNPSGTLGFIIEIGAHGVLLQNGIVSLGNGLLEGGGI